MHGTCQENVFHKNQNLEFIFSFQGTVRMSPWDDGKNAGAGQAPENGRIFLSFAPDRNSR